MDRPAVPDSTTRCALLWCVCTHLDDTLLIVFDVFMCGSECGGVLEGPSGTFSYPNTPGHDQYDHMVSCAWVVRTDADKVSDNL